MSGRTNPRHPAQADGAARRIVAALVLLLAAGTLSNAQESGLTVSGFVKPTVFVQPWPANSDDMLPFAGTTGGLRLDLDAGDFGLFRLGMEGFVNANRLFASQGSESSWRIVYPLAVEASLWGRAVAMLDFKELFWELSLGDVDLRIGKQVLAWGLADGSNPTDTVNARFTGTRYTTTLEEQKMGAIAIDAVYYLPDSLGKIEGVFMPLYNPNQIPWPPANITAVSGPVTVRTNFAADPAPEFGLDRMEGGLRALFTLEGFEFSLSWLTLMDRFMDISARTVTTGMAPFLTITNTLTPVYNRVNQFGVDWALSLAGFDFRGEAAFTLTKDVDGVDIYTKNPWLRGVVQLSRSWNGPDSTLSAALTWAPQYVFSYREPSSFGTLSTAADMMRKYAGQAFAFEQGLGLRLSGTFLKETVSPELLALYNIAAQDFLAQAALKWNLAAGVNLRVLATIYGSVLPAGDAAREYGTFSRSDTDARDNIAVEIRWDF